jgi:hypothetical protein
MELASGYISRDNERYGIVRDMIDPQDEINKRRSKMLHQLTMRQVKTERGALAEGVDYARRELSKPDGVIEVNPGMMFEILPSGEQVSGQAALLQHASEELENMGPNASMQGIGGEEQSGRAIIAQQQGGMVAIATLMDRLRGFNKRVYRQIWWRVQQYWTEERWIRVTDDENRPRHVGLNQQITGEMAFREALLAEGVGEDVVDQEMAQFRMRPEMQEIVEVRNQVGEMDVDILLEDVPDVVTIQSEQFDQMISLASTGAVAFPQEVWIEMAPGLRNKKRLLDMMRGGEDPQAAQAQAEMQQQVVSLEMAEKAATVENIEAQAAERQAKALKIGREAGVV